mmetsp:Transcript_10331/g.12342  ORF Transcript_10331/g.12342 Transcript_10331/m.12342 type:complete len:185 (+) Transcript_10331:2425-2979(+)
MHRYKFSSKVVNITFLKMIRNKFFNFLSNVTPKDRRLYKLKSNKKKFLKSILLNINCANIFEIQLSKGVTQSSVLYEKKLDLNLKNLQLLGTKLEYVSKNFLEKNQFLKSYQMALFDKKKFFEIIKSYNKKITKNFYEYHNFNKIFNKKLSILINLKLRKSVTNKMVSFIKMFYFSVKSRTKLL